MDRSEVHQFLRINDFGGEPKTGPHYLTIAHTSSAAARPQLFPFKPGFLFVLGDLGLKSKAARARIAHAPSDSASPSDHHRIAYPPSRRHACRRGRIGS